MSRITDHAVQLFQRPTVTSELAQDPNATVKSVCERIYQSSGLRLHGGDRHPVDLEIPFTDEELKKAVQTGSFPYEPSRLFQQVYAAILTTLDQDPLINLCSPALMASAGTIPLSIISVIPDIMRHYASVIVEAKSEIILATNYWEASVPAKIVTDAFRELNRRCAAENRRVVIKMMYDRGNLHQIMEPHQHVPPEVYTAKEVLLPRPDEIPNLDLEVINFHKPVLGTFHAKYMIVDRKIACLNSNNIQERVNLEMMTHIEGEIVQAFYDMALITWNNAMKPPLPLLGATPSKDIRFGQEHPHIANVNLDASQEAAIKTLKDGSFPASRASNAQRNEKIMPETEEYFSEEASEDKTDFSSGDKKSKLAAITKRLNTDSQNTTGTFPSDQEVRDFRPHVIHKSHGEVPMAFVNRKPRGSLDFKEINMPQDIAWLAAIRFAQKNVFIQTPTFTAPPVIEACLAAAKRGIVVTIYACLGYNDAGENMPKQGGSNSIVFKKAFDGLEDKYKQNFRVYWYTAADMSKPIHAKHNQRTCHIKIMIVDEQIGIQGNGNQDAQSWYHSQEINIMVDSADICREWREGLDRNQNTDQYGLLAADGLWRDSDGKELPDAGDTKGGITAFLKGVQGTIKRVQGEGGY